MRPLKFTLFYLFFISINIFAQKYSNDFLSIGVDARAISMSNSVVASSNDVSSGFYNPAGLNSISSTQIGLMHSSYFAGITQYDYLGGAFRVDTQLVVAASFIRFGVDDILNTTELIDENGNINYNNISMFSATDFAAIFSIAKKTKSNVNLGLSTKLIHRKIGPFANSWGIGLDFGMQFQSENWIFGVLFKDLSTTINFWDINQDAFSSQYEETGNIIPDDDIEITYPQIFCGLAREFNLFRDFTLLSELDIVTTWDGRRNTLVSNNLFSINPSIGLECGYKKIAFLRFGIGNFQKEILINTNERMTLQPNFGIGVNVWSFKLDYSLTNLGNASASLYSNVFSFKYNF